MEKQRSCCHPPYSCGELLPSPVVTRCHLRRSWGVVTRHQPFSCVSLVRVVTRNHRRQSLPTDFGLELSPVSALPKTRFYSCHPKVVTRFPNFGLFGMIQDNFALSVFVFSPLKITPDDSGVSNIKLREQVTKALLYQLSYVGQCAENEGRVLRFGQTR